MLVRVLVLIMSVAMALSAQSAELKKVTLMLDWYKNPNHAPILLALARGDYAAKGIDLVVQEPADPNDPPKLASAKAVDIAISYQPTVMMLIDKGVPVARVGALIPTPLNTVMVLSDGPIKTLKDLKGRRIGYSVAGFEDALLGAMLTNVALTPRDVTLVNVNFALATSLLAGQTDAVIGAFRNFETHQMALKGCAVRVFAVEAHGVPTYEELVFVTNTDSVRSKAVSDFLEVTRASAGLIARDPTAAWKSIITKFPGLNDELNRRAFADTAP